MSEYRRVISFYRPRIQIPVETMSSEPGRWSLYCLPVDGVNALQRIAPYLKREVTYIGETISNTQFAGPTTAEMESIIDLVGELESALLSECDMSLIIDAIDRNTEAITALQCVCSSLQLNRSSGALGDNIETLIDSGEVIPSDELPIFSPPPQSDENACAIAQLYYAWVWEVTTETVLPALRGTFDHLIPVLAALVGTATGGIGFIPMYLIAEAIQELIEIGYNGAETNLVNWLYSVKDDWVCMAYEMLKAGTSDRAVADAIKAGIIDVADDISFGDKTIVSFIGAPWSVQAAFMAWANQTSWALQNVTAGYCSVCPPPPAGECLDIGACNLGAWEGGTVECVQGLATIKGGSSWWNEDFITVGLGQYLVVWFYPRSDGYPEAETNWGLWSDTDEQRYDVIQGGLNPVDQYTMEWAPIPAALNGHDVTLDMQQDVYWASPVKWCIMDESPV